MPAVLGLERARGAFGDQPPAGDDGQAVHRLLGLHHVVGDQEDRAALLPEGADLVPQQPAAQGVDVVGGLVQDHHPPRLDRHHGEADQPLDPSRQLLAHGVAPLADVQRLDELVGAAAHGRSVAAADPPGQLDGLVHPERVDRHLGLREVRAQLAGRVGIGDQVIGSQGDPASGRLEQPDDLLDQGRLAGAVGPEQAVDLARLHLQGDLVVGPVGAVVDLGDGLGPEAPVLGDSHRPPPLGHRLTPTVSPPGTLPVRSRPIRLAMATMVRIGGLPSDSGNRLASAT